MEKARGNPVVWVGLVYQGKDYSPKYSISEFGDVVNNFTGRILQPGTNQGGYMYVCISCPDEKQKRRTIIIHKAVAYSFLRAPTNCSMVVDHIDANKKNNHYLNLEWVTAAENSMRAYNKGLFKAPEPKNRKLTPNQVAEIKTILADGKNRPSLNNIAKMFGVSRHTIYLIANNKMHRTIRAFSSVGRTHFS